MTDRPTEEGAATSTEDLAAALRQPASVDPRTEVRPSELNEEPTRGGRADTPTPDEQLAADDREPLLPPAEMDDLRRRWDDVQFTFVDEPREAVAKADAMVADLAQRLISSFAAERQHLESQWTTGDDVSTEELRVALRRYRSFFERLLAA